MTVAPMNKQNLNTERDVYGRQVVRRKFGTGEVEDGLPLERSRLLLLVESWACLLGVGAAFHLHGCLAI